MLCSIRVKGRNFCFSGYLTFVPVYVIGAAAKIMPKRYSWKENGRSLNFKEVFGWKTESNYTDCSGGVSFRIPRSVLLDTVVRRTKHRSLFAIHNVDDENIGVKLWARITNP